MHSEGGSICPILQDGVVIERGRSDMLDAALIESLARVVGDGNVSTREDDLERYSADALTPSRAFKAAPSMQKLADVVVLPHEVHHVVEVVKLALAYEVPVVPYGGGTGVMGAALPVRGGIVLDLKGLNRVLDVNTTDRTVLVEAGVVLEDLAKALEDHGLMLGHDPWSLPIATVAGAISTNGVGYRASSYGSMGEQVLGLEAVLPSGEILTTRSVPKYSSGPNLNHLFIGTEGVFGIITKASLRVFRQPETRSFATVGFDSFDQGFKAVAELFAMGLHPALVDLTEEGEDGVQLYMMCEGYKEGVAAQKQRALQVCSSFGGKDLGEGGSVDYWRDRYSTGVWYRQEMLDQPRSVRWQQRGRGLEYLHVALPVSQVLEYRRLCEEAFTAREIRVVEYAVWTQPELFSMLIVPAGKVTDESLASLSEAADEVLALAQDMGGSMEYCHGVGVKLAHLLPREMGVGMDVAKALKQALDPHNIMNPGKLF